MPISDREYIGPAQSLANVALALYLAHEQGITTDAIGIFTKFF
jgi:hypothetical protein